MKQKENPSPAEHADHVRLNPRVNEGLTPSQVESQRAAGLTNHYDETSTRSVSTIIKENLFTYFNLVFLILAALVIAAGSFRSLTFLPVVIINSLIGIIQELRAKKELDALTLVSSPKVTVIRSGQKQEVSTEELVQDDIVEFHAGDQICADAILLTGSCSVNESLLTGEEDEVIKNTGDLLSSGSYLVSGTCRARLEHIGADSYVARLSTQAKEMDRKEQSEMLRVLDKLVAGIGIAILPIGALLFWQQYVQADAGFQASIVSMVAAIVGMIPEGLYLLTSVALAVSVIRLSQQKVLVHNMKCIETLARVDVLCVDKTGTITEPDMHVTAMIPLPGHNPTTMLNLKCLLSNFAAAQNADNLTMRAVKEYFVKPSKELPTDVLPFSSAWKYSSVSFGEQHYVLGAPELILRDAYSRIQNLVENYSADGNRVILFAACKEKPSGERLSGEVTELALLLLSNPVRKEARETFQYFDDQGVTIKVISGDNPITVSQIAREAGIEGADRFVDASTLSEDNLLDALEHNTVFGRVTPDQKRQLVRALKNAGHTVGMTGDGVNDILALKDADCSIAMASGCEAASQVSQLVLLENNFSCMPSVVAEGRRVVNNIQRSASLFLVKNIFSLLMAVFSVCFHLSYPLEPAQVSLISTFTIGFPAFFLSLQPEHKRIEGKFLRNVLLKAFPAGITDFVIVGALVMFGQVFQVNEDEISTACTMLLAIVGFMILYRICAPLDWRRWIIWGGSAFCLLGSSIFLGDLFGIGHMNIRCVMLFVLFAIATEPLLRYGILATEATGSRYNAHKEKKSIGKRRKKHDNSK